jgi:hypothetical protein
MDAGSGAALDMSSDEATIIVVDDDLEMASMLCDIPRDAGSSPA